MLLQQAAVSRDSLADTAVVRSPLPGGISPIVRWLFGLPQWLQAAGAAVGAIIALIVLVMIWRRRAPIIAWVGSRSRQWKMAAIGIGLVVVAGAAAFGMVSWHYMMHDNDFCVSCHVMTPAFQRFQVSEHKTLQCHDCHRQSIFASMRQLYYWVAERPLEIPKHAPVPTRICAECHLQEKPDSIWQRVSATAGHRVHLNSDSAALKNIQCVTCHGREVHHFVPVNQTCGQANCHESVRIQLGKMASQTSMHCVGCHQFKVPVSEQISVDSTKRALTPGMKECFGCHEMRSKLASFDSTADRHGGKCGSCHDPHKQKLPSDAFTTCENAGCHARADTLTPLHRGLPAATLKDCSGCHEAHQWTVKDKACLSCHRGILEDQPLRRRSASAPSPAGRPTTTAPGEVARRPASFSARRVAFVHFASLATTDAGRSENAVPQQAATYTRGSGQFSHRRHKALECSNCHNSERTHGEITVKTIRDCQTCHHTAEKTPQKCETCHTASERADTKRMNVTVTATVFKEPRPRTLSFRHNAHEKLECATCHTTPVTMAVTKDCASCHDDHHTVGRNCAACHADAKSVHKRTVHNTGCGGSGCHSDKATLALAPARQVCLACHSAQMNHKAGRDCAGCHTGNWRPSAAGGAGS